MRNFILVGFMGTGKTAVGTALADKLQVSLVDTDDLIVAAAGKSIPAIFTEDGEEVFRSWETKILQRLVRESGQEKVISTGGGIVLAERNWPLLRQLGHVICLQAKIETILCRVGTGRGRPLLTGKPEEVKNRIGILLAQRAPAYARADWLCPTDLQTPPEIADSILAWQKNQVFQKGQD